MSDNIFKDMANAIGALLFNNNRELITLLRTPTPIKIVKVLEVDPSGCIGGGQDSPTPVTLYTAPASTEAWLHRITITSPEYTADAPLQIGGLRCTGSTAEEPIFSLPHRGDLTDVYILEGRLSAPHLNASEAAWVVGQSMPPGIHLRFDLQIILSEGLSEFTPRRSSPTNLDARTPKDTFTLID
jgi:hypothetical protein